MRRPRGKNGIYARPVKLADGSTVYVWCLKWRLPDGSYERKALGIKCGEADSLKRALEAADRYKVDARAQLAAASGVPQDYDPGAQTLDALLQADFTEAQGLRGAAPGTLRGLQYAYKAVRAFFGGGSSPARISYTTVTQYVAYRRAAGVKGQSIVRELQCLKRVARAAHRRGWILAPPQEWPKVKRDPKDVKRSGKYIQPETLKRWLAELAPAHRAFAQFVALTGLRHEEAARLEFDDIRGDLLVLREEASKTGVRMVPLSLRAREIVEERLLARTTQLAAPEELRNARFTEAHANLVFPRCNYNYFFRRAARRIGHPCNIHPRDLRHTYATIIARKDPVAAMRLLGHTDLKTTEIYTHSTQEWLAEASGNVATALDFGHSVVDTVPKLPERS